jgi:hypothetical protein
MGGAGVFLGVGAMVMLTWLGVWLHQRGLGKDGARRTSTSLGDGFGNLIDVFDPAQARASRDLKDQQHQGPVTPTPDRDPDDPIQMELGPGGVPHRVRIRKPR